MDDLDIQLRSWLRGDDPARRSRAAELALKLGRSELLAGARTWFEPHGDDVMSAGHGELGDGPAGRLTADESALEHAPPKTRRLLAGERTGAILLGRSGNAYADVPFERRLGSAWHESLTSLRIFGTPAPSQLDELAALRRLRNLELDVREDSSLSPLAACEALRTLSLLLPAEIPRALIEELTRLPRLERLVLCGYPLASLEPLAGMTNLRSLALRRPRMLVSLGGVAELPSLVAFELADCDDPCDLEPLVGCARLAELTLLRCRHASDLPRLESAPLRRARLMLPALITLGGLGRTVSWLSINGCEALADLDDLADATELSVLEARGCRELASLSGLAGARRLVWIDLRGCSAPADDLDVLEELPDLVHLELSGELAAAARTRARLLPKLQIAPPPARQERGPLGEYRVLRVLGQGGMGRVVEMAHPTRGTFAVKAPRPELLSSVAAFVAEARAWIDLGIHPNIVSCFYVRIIDGVPHAFAQCVYGASLLAHIERRSLYARDSPLEILARILDLAIQIAWGIAYAHEQGLVHQDLKPANVMVTTDYFRGSPFGNAKVTDFGLARASSPAAIEGAEPTVTRLGLTPAYASPEQLHRTRITRASDVWSWGLTLLQMFTRQLTWSRGDQGPRALDAFVATQPSAPPAVVAVLRQCLSVDPATRPTMEYAADALIAAFNTTVGGYHRSRPQAGVQHAGSLNNRAVSLLELGDEQEARAALAQALGLEPSHLEASFNAAVIALRHGEIDRDEALRRIPGAPSAERLRAFIRREARQRPGDAHLRAPYALTRPDHRYGWRDGAAVPHMRNLMRALERDDAAAAVACLEEGRRAALASTEGLDLAVSADLAKGTRALLRRCQRGELRGERRAQLAALQLEHVALSADGEFALENNGDMVWLFDLTHRYRMLDVPVTGATTALGLSRDGLFMATGDAGGVVRVHTAVRDAFGSYRAREIVEHRADGPVRSICFDASGRRCIAAWQNGVIACIDVPAAHMRWVARGSAVTELAVAWNGRIGACIDDPSGSHVTIYDLHDGRPVAASHLAMVATQVAVAPDGRHAWLRSDDDIATVDMATARVVHVDAIASSGRVALAVDGTMLVPGESEHRLIDFATPERRCVGRFPARGARSVMALSADGTVAVLTDGRRVDRFRLEWNIEPRARVRWDQAAWPWLTAFSAGRDSRENPSSEEMAELLSELALACLGWIDRAGIEERLP